MSPFSPLLKLAGKMPRWKPSIEEQQKEAARLLKREYNRIAKREWRKKNGRH